MTAAINVLKSMLLHKIIIFLVACISPNLYISVKLAQKRRFEMIFSKHGTSPGKSFAK